MSIEDRQFDNEPVAKLLHDLKRVDAPNDFDFKVRARIAAGQPSESRGVPVWVKAAVPLGLLLAVGGYFGLNAVYSPTSKDVPAVAVVKPLPQIEPPAAPVASTPQVTAPAPAATQNTVAVTTRKPVRPTQPAGGSLDSAVQQSETLDIRDRSASDAFSEIGVKGTIDAAGMKVDSADARSGLRTGDVVETVNGQAVDPKTTVKGKLAGKTVRVRRDGKSLDIVIKN